MEDDLLEFDGFEDLGVCFKNNDFRVIHQNKLCEKLCGKRLGKICKDGCMCFNTENIRHPFKDFGIKFHQGKQLRASKDSFYDICFIKTIKGLLTLLYPLEEVEAGEIKLWKKLGLTKREIEICLLKARGKSNIEIEKGLFISKATVKTHLNHIYQKLSELKGYTLGIREVSKG